MRGLIERGYSPVQAAALAGHVLQESGGDPTNVNPKEDAHGLLQWRLDRWKSLQDFAKERGTAPTDPQLQLDFIGRELGGSEAKAGAGFRAATDLPSASAALKPYIRFGDNSDQARLNNARGLFGQAPQSAPAPASAASPSPQVAPGVPGTSPAPEQPDSGLAEAIAAIPKRIAEQQQVAAPPPLDLQPVQPMITPQMIRARQLAQAMLSRSLNPGSQS